MKKLGFAALAVASIFLMVSVALAEVAISTGGEKKGIATRIDFPAGTTATRDPFDLSTHIGFAKMTINGVRDSNTEGYEYFSTITGNITGINTDGSNAAKTYGLYINLTRAAGADTLTGDLDDAGAKIRVTNSATANTAGNTMRGIDVDVSNTAHGVITSISGGIISSQVKTPSATNGSVTNQRGLEVNCTDNGYVTDLLIPLDVRLFRQGATVPTLECVARLRNGNTTGTGAVGLRIESESGTPAKFTTAIDLSAASVTATGSDVKLSNGARVYSGTAVTRAAVRALVGDSAPQGSLFIGLTSVATTKPNMYIKTGAGNADSDWERIVTQASD